MRKLNKLTYTFLLAFYGVCTSLSVYSKDFTHPGGLHTLEDLERMKEKVQRRETPWIESWNVLIQNWKAQSTYTAGPSSNIGGSGNRQRASQDANAAYLNTLRWYISGNTSHADCAVRILNSWARTVTEASGELFQLPIKNMMYVAELLRIYPGWKEEDQEKFKEVAIRVFYPSCRDFLGTCWRPASWDSPAAASLLAIGIFCDREDIYNEGIEYFKNGIGNGSLLHSIWQENGQIAEMGRDQPHATIGPACLAEMAQMAFNQGDNSLYEYENNRLLAGFEYYCKYNLNHKEVPFEKWYSCIEENLSYMSPSGANRIRQSPVYEMLYNHYVFKMGMPAPYTQAMAELARPEQYDDADFFGGGTLTYTLLTENSPYPPHPIPEAPVELTTYASDSYVILNWKAASENSAQGYSVYRSLSPNGSYSQIASWNNNTSTEYTDHSVKNGTTYYYTVTANNQSGTSPRSDYSAATPEAATDDFLPGWFTTDIGTAQAGNTGKYLNGSYFLSSYQGDWIGDNKQRMILGLVKGDFTFTARMFILENDHEWERGIMVRETLRSQSKMIALATGWPLIRYSKAHYRSFTGGERVSVNAHQFLSIPCWFRIERKGNQFIVYESGEGIYWTEVITRTITMQETCYVALFNTSGNSVFDHVTVDCDPTLTPESPTHFNAEALDYKTTRLSWSESPIASGYVLERSKDTEDHYEVIAPSVSQTSYEDTGLETGTKYFYRIRAANMNGISESPTTTHIQLELSRPLAPEITQLENGNSKVTLEWKPTGDQYHILRSETQGGPYEKIALTDTHFYTDVAVENNILYYYVITAINEAGESEYSAEATGQPNVGKYIFFPFEENQGTQVKDEWSNLRGSLYSGVSWTTGKYGNGVKFNGSNLSYISLPNGLVTPLKSYSISLWVYLDEAKDWTRIFDFGTGESYYMFLTAQAYSGKLRFALKNGGTEQFVESNAGLSLKRWHHVVITSEWDNEKGNGNGKLYVNGALKGSNTNLTINPSMLPSTTQNYLGKSQYTSDPYLNGILDEFRIYQTALSAAQVRDLYISSTSVEKVESSPWFQVHPNPFDHQLTVSFGEEIDLPVVFYLYDIEGKLINSFPCVDRENSLELPALAKGIYLGIFVSNGQKHTVKLVKR